MSEFDAERYLRLVGERALLDRPDRGSRPWGSPLGAAAQALVAVGAIEEQAAEDLLDDYGLAEALRSPENHPAQRRLGGRPARPTPGPAPQLGPRRVFACAREIATPGGVVQVRYVSLSPDSTRIGVSVSTTSAGAARSGRRRPQAMRAPAYPPFGGPGQQLTLADDRGGSTVAHFSGGGDEHEWRGHLEAARPLAHDTAWIELNGERIELAGSEPPVEVSIEPLPGQTPAIRHLWRLVIPARPHLPGMQSAQPAIDALVACGALAIDDPAIDEAQAAREAVAHEPLGSGPGAPRLPDPWGSLLTRRGTVNGREGSLVVGAVTPPFDGISVAVTTLESSAEDWTIETEVVPDVVMQRPFEHVARHRSLAWWAADDRGNHYLGAAGRWSGGGERGAGEISFWPPLDPAATELVLMPTAETERAVIRLPLRWERTQDGAE